MTSIDYIHVFVFGKRWQHIKRDPPSYVCTEGLVGEYLYPAQYAPASISHSSQHASENKLSHSMQPVQHDQNCVYSGLVVVDAGSVTDL